MGHSREELQQLKRADLQRIGKELGLKANLKSDSLIEQILDADNSSATPEESSKSPDDEPPATRTRTRSGAGSVQKPASKGRSTTRSKASQSPKSRQSSRVVSTTLPRSRTRSGGEVATVPEEAEEQDDELEEGAEPREGGDQPAAEASPPSSPRRRSSRMVSVGGARPRHESTSTVVIHDDEEDEEEELAANGDDDGTTPHTEPSIKRKAKDTQFRLGVGRPVVAGGRGARAVTKAVSTSIGASKRAKSGRVAKAPEPTIHEEEEEEKLSQHEDVKGNNGIRTEVPHSRSSQDPSRPVSDDVTSSLQPLQRELDTLRAQLAMRTHDINDLKSRVDTLQADNEVLRRNFELFSKLESQVREIRASLGTTMALSDPRNATSAPIANATDSSNATAGSSNVIGHMASAPPQAPGIAPKTLGKRRRNSNASSSTGVVVPEPGEEQSRPGPQDAIARHGKKRARLAEEVQPSTPPDDPDEMYMLNQEPTGQSIPSFTVFTGPEEQSYDGPPTQRLPHAYAPSPVGGGPPTATAYASENQRPPALPNAELGFNQTLTDTPGPGVSSTAAYSYLTEPQSPSPMPSLVPGASHVPSGSGYGHTIERAGGRRERNDLFHPFGTPIEERIRGQVERPQSPASVDVGVNPALLLRPSSSAAAASEPVLMRNDLGLGFSFLDQPTKGGQQTPAGPKTMFGTELEGDSRFGDFGVEGVASGFWTGGRY